VSAPLTNAVLQPMLAELHRSRPDEPLIGVRLDAPWAGGPQIMIGEDLVAPVRECRAPIDVWSASAEQEKLGTPLVILTPLSDRELGLDMTARLAGQRLLRPSPARAVMQLFSAHDLDRRIAREEWLLRALLEHVPPGGYAPAQSGALTAERAWEELLRTALEIPSGNPTLRELLLWSLSQHHLARLWGAGPEMREGVRARLATLPGAALLLAIAENAGDPADVLALLAVISVLVAAPGEPASLLAAGRIAERNLGGRQLQLGPDGAPLVQAADAIVRGDGGPDKTVAWQSRAIELIGELALTELVERSDLLDGAWSARLSHFGAALEAAVRGGDDPRGLDDAEAALRRHIRAATSGGVLESVTAMRRLARWLAAGPGPAPASLSAAIREEVRDGGYVARARADLTASGAPELAAGADALAAAVDARRAASSKVFAVAATRWDGEPGPGLLGVEHVLDHVVAPVARASSTLVIVLDGLSLAVLRALLEDLDREGWIERRPAAIGERPTALAVLPSLTMRSRASLLTGRLTTGGQTDEAAGFAAHAGLREAGTAHGAPLLMHKRALSHDGTTLSIAVRDEIFGRRRVVGMVINAIDDELSGAVQRHSGWSLRAIPLLDAALNAARDAGRAVVLLSDHGHVPERTATHRVPAPTGSGDRHRSAAGDPAAAGEVLAEGRRVLTADGRAILAADPSIRYTSASKPGYHGGASPEELVAPVAIVTAFDTEVDGLVDQEPDEPSWWRDVLGSEAGPDAMQLPGAPAIRGPSRPPVVAVQGQQIMFEVPGVDVAADQAAAPPEPEWVGALLGHDQFRLRRKRAGRGAPGDERIRALLSALARHDGRLSPAALAVAAGVPAGRLDGLLAALRPLVNIDGYPILTVDRDAELVELRIADLRRQLGI
jgi:PglZ domain